MQVVLGGLVVRVFAVRPKVRGVKAGRERYIFKSDKYPQHAIRRRGSQVVSPV